MIRNETVKGWLKLSRAELDEIYKKADAGKVPRGDTLGTAIVTGSLLARCYASFARLFAWQGKVFDLFPPDYEEGILLNKITPFSLTFVVAKVYRDTSWMDGRETIVIDYSKTSFVAGKLRDEIREVVPGIYLGKVWFGKIRILDFALTYKDPDRIAPQASA